MIELALLVALTMSGQFDQWDTGIGGRLGWRPVQFVGVEGELTFYPGDFPDGRPFSRRRMEGLFGVTAGPAFGPVRPFVKVRPGFLAIAEAPEPFPCILIFPPPIACALAAGDTVFALDVGGGLEMTVTPRMLVRADVSDRMVRYAGPVFEGSPLRIREDSFFGHHLRIAISAGARF